MTALLETRGVWQRFGGLVANSDISISVGRGEIVGIDRPRTAAGKSTLFNLIAGRAAADARARSCSTAERRHPAFRRRSAASAAKSARTFQVVKSFETMTVIDNVIVWRA